MLKKDDFVTLNVEFKDLVKNSVGVIEELNLDENKCKVFFFGKRLHIDIDLSLLNFLNVFETGKPFQYKICNVCHILKEDLVEFDVNQTDAKGRKTTRPSCKTCRIDIDGVKLTTSERRRMKNIEPKKYFECPICGKGSIPGITANLVIDHDHKTGNARSWLCDSCNTGLGRFKDDIELLEKAIEYLKQN